MSEIVKAFLKSLIDKKARTFLVLFSIAVSASLIFANESFSRTVTQRFYEADVRWGANSDFYIQPKEAVGAKEWIDPQKLAGYGDSFEYAFQWIKARALYMPSLEQMHYFTILGADIAEFNRHNPIALSQGDFQDWRGFNIIVGQTYANLYHLKVGDRISLELNNTAYDFKIIGISQPKGLFLRELADGGFILAPKDTLAKIFACQPPCGGSTNLLFLKLKDPAQKEAVYEKLASDFSDYQVDYAINGAVIAAETQQAVMPFQVSSIVVLFMCMFIIYTAFNLITLERIPIVGTLRSIGCTRKMINIILIIESACLGAVGGLIGCVLGVGVLQYIKYRFFTGEDAVINATVAIDMQAVLIAVGAAVIITTASAILPILRITRTPIKNIILNDLDKGRAKTSRWWIAGVILLVACGVVPQFLGVNFTSMIIASGLATAALVGLVPLVPFLTYHLTRLIGQLPFLSQDIVLGIRNIRDNQSLMNNIQLFSAAIAIVAFMASMFNTMGKDLVANFENNMKFDVALVLRHSDPQSLATLSKVSGVKSYQGFYLTHTSIANYQTFMNSLYGVEESSFFDYLPVGGLNDRASALANLNQGKNIITSNILKGKLGLKLGDILRLKFGSNEVDYRIIGFVETNLGIGHVGYISAANYREDMGVVDYDTIYITTDGSAQTLKNNILRELNKEVMSIQTKADFTASIADKVVSLFAAINSYCYLALLVGIIGIVNNLVASFIERKRSFAMYRCVGMSKKSLNRMLITEAVGMGVFGVTFGLLCTLIMSSAIPAAVSVLWGKVTVQLAVDTMAVMAGVGILAMLAISVVPVLRHEKLDLIETIKYE
jgi:putative ABC transport system permease protein